jgi:hypothetical protein
MTHNTAEKLRLPFALALLLSLLLAASAGAQQSPSPAVMSSRMASLPDVFGAGERWLLLRESGFESRLPVAPDLLPSQADTPMSARLDTGPGMWLIYLPAVLKHHSQIAQPTLTATRTGQPTDTPTATPSSTATQTATRTPTATPTTTGTAPHTATPSSTATPTATPTPTTTRTATQTATLAPSATVTPPYTASPSATVTSTATPTGTPSATATSTATPTLTSTPPSTPTATATEPAGAWVSIFSEDFEGAFPGEWEILDNTEGPGVYHWGARDCRSHSGSHSGWAVGGGAQGRVLPCYSDYPSNVDSWMIYGPFSLADALQAEIDLAVWLNTEVVFDGFGIYASVDDEWYYEVGWANGDWEMWLNLSYSLSEVPELGSLLGEPQVWVALVFEADDSIVFSEGCYVDDIALLKCISGPCTGGGTSAASSGANGTALASTTNEVPQTRPKRLRPRALRTVAGRGRARC